MTQKDADDLLKCLKEMLYSTINIPNPGIKKEYEARNISGRDKFAIVIRRGGRNPNKCSFFVMTKDTKIGLLRLDVVGDNVSHRNPDGQMIYGTHLHVYKEGNEIGYAIEFDIKNENLIPYCIDFMRRINIIDYDKKLYRDDLTLFN